MCGVRESIVQKRSLSRTKRPGRCMLVYGDLLALQRECFDTMWQRANKLSGSFARDLVIVNSCAGDDALGARENRSPASAEQARRWIAQGEPAVESMLSRLANVLDAGVLRPPGHAAVRAVPGAGWRISRRSRDDAGRQPLSVLRWRSAGLDSRRQPGSRTAAPGTSSAATCSTRVGVSRTRCAYCGETEPRRIGYYHSPAFEHMRVDTCDACQHYLKSIDLTGSNRPCRSWTKSPPPTLDAWARDHGYQKIELNIVEL